MFAITRLLRSNDHQARSLVEQGYLTTIFTVNRARTDLIHFCHHDKFREQIKASRQLIDRELPRELRGLSRQAMMLEKRDAGQSIH